MLHRSKDWLFFGGGRARSLPSPLASATGSFRRKCCPTGHSTSSVHFLCWWRSLRRCLDKLERTSPSFSNSTLPAQCSNPSTAMPRLARFVRTLATPISSVIPWATTTFGPCTFTINLQGAFLSLCLALSVLNSFIGYDDTILTNNILWNMLVETLDLDFSVSCKACLLHFANCPALLLCTFKTTKLPFPQKCMNTMMRKRHANMT